MSVDDTELLSAYVREKDAEAFAALVARYESLVYATGMRQVRNGADAEDISQEVFLTLARKAHKICSDNLGGWLFRCAVNAANSKLRSDVARNRRERARPVPEGSPESTAEWRQIEAVLNDCLAELDAADRELVIQRFFVNRSQSDLAATLGVDQATVSRRLKKAVERLRFLMTAKGISLTSAILATSLTKCAEGAAVPVGLS